MRVTPILTLIFMGIVAMAQAYSPPDLRAEVKIRLITSACAAFEAEYGLFPPRTNWFAELTATTNAVLNRRKLAFLDAKDMTDPWGRNLVYRQPGKHNTSSVDIYSLGSDGRSSSEGNDPDDINNWNSREPWRKYYSRTDITFQQVVIVIGGIGVVLVLTRFIWHRMAR